MQHHKVVRRFYAQSYKIAISIETQRCVVYKSQWDTELCERSESISQERSSIRVWLVSTFIDNQL